jgi:hypothetical protein
VALCDTLVLGCHRVQVVISVTDALPGLSGLLWEGWVGVQHVCGMRNGWPQVALYGSLERSEPMHGRE